MTASVPAGFVPFPKFGGFIDNSGPFFRADLVDGRRRYGFRTAAKHANPNGVIHGGVLVTFVDTCMGQAVVDATSDGPDLMTATSVWKPLDDRS